MNRSGISLLVLVAIFASSSAAKSDAGVVDLLKAWNINAAVLESSSDLPSQCVAVIEKVKDFTAEQFQGCAEVKNLCSPCSKCKKFTTLAQADTSKEVCVCAVTSDSGLLGKTSNKDDCFISPYGNDFNAPTTVDLAGGNDCAIIVGAQQSSDLIINGGVGNDVLLQLNDHHLATGTGAITLNGGAGEDCIYVQDDIETLNGDAGRDVLIVDGAKGDKAIAINGGAENDFIVGVAYLNNVNLNAFGGAGNDEIFVGGQNVGQVEGGYGNDKIFLLSEAFQGQAFYLNGKEGNDYINVASNAVAYGVVGDLGDDSVHISGIVRNGVVLNEGSDNLVVNGIVNGDIDLGDGDNVVLIKGKVQNIDGGADNDKIVIASGGVVNGDVDLMEGDNTFSLHSSAILIGNLDALDGVNVLDFNGKVNGAIAAGNGGNSVHLFSDGVVNGIVLGDGDDHVVVSGKALADIVLGDGNNDIQVKGSAFLIGDVIGGLDDDVFSVESSAVVIGVLMGADGNDAASVSGKVGEIDLAGDDDIVRLNSGAVVGNIADNGGDNILYLSENTILKAPLALGGNDVCYVPYNYDDDAGVCEDLYRSTSSSS